MLLLSMAAGSASALRSVSINVKWIPLLAREVTFTALGARVVCEVGLTMHPNPIVIPKVLRSLIGRAEVKVLGQESSERCIENRMKVLVGRETEGEFNIIYLSFSGILPLIAGLNFQLLRVAFQVNIGSGLAVCLVVANILGTERVTVVRLEQFSGPGETRFGLEEVSVTRVSGTICPEPREVTLAGTFRPTANMTLILL